MVQFRILGPLEVDSEGSSVAVGGAKQRALLAILLLSANGVVAADRLVDELWGQRPPESGSYGAAGASLAVAQDARPRLAR